MILATLDILQDFILPINFSCHIMIFLGGFYIALHSRILPKWLSTCIWYAGLASCLTAITVILEWMYGATFDLAYTQIGLFGETLLNIILAITVGLLFARTIFKDFQSIKNRKINN